MAPTYLGKFLFWIGVIVLQPAMPPAFVTLVLADTALAAGSIGLLFTLPVWLWLFGT